VLVGVDIGGTKTHLAVERDGSVDHQVVPTSAWQRDGLLDKRGLVRLLELVGPRTPGSDRGPLVVGAHGCDSPEQVERLEELLRDLWQGPVRAVNDAELLAPAYGVDHAICLIVGTGSIVVGRTTEGDPVYVGGHGWLLDDYGSAPGLTREAVRAVLTATDEGRVHDGLAARLMQHFSVTDEVHLSMRFTALAGIRAWAEPAPLVFEAADAGSQTAVAVINAAAERLAHQVVRARERGAVGHTVITAGGVVAHQPRLFDALAHHLSQLDHRLDLRLLEVAPVVGALQLARRLEGQLPNPSRLVHDTTGGDS
jgi:N-acetylglucosamine kinase-like BadF-type ATPase